MARPVFRAVAIPVVIRLTGSRLRLLLTHAAQQQTASPEASQSYDQSRHHRAGIAQQVR